MICEKIVWNGDIELTCSCTPALRDRPISLILINCSAHKGQLRSSPSLRFLRLTEWPHMKCTAGNSKGAPVTAHLLFWNTRACSRIDHKPLSHNSSGPSRCTKLRLTSGEWNKTGVNWHVQEIFTCLNIWCLPFDCSVNKQKANRKTCKRIRPYSLWWGLWSHPQTVSYELLPPCACLLYIPFYSKAASCNWKHYFGNRDELDPFCVHS